MEDPSQILSGLLALGFDENISQEAASVCPSVESAVAWILDHQGDLAIQSEPRNIKMVMVVRSDLSMSPGKIAAQCVHAALGAYRIAASSDPQTLSIWEDSGEKAVCLKCPGQAELRALCESAAQAGLINYLVRDAGRTQVDPGSETVLAIGPADEHLINAITGSLKLY